MKRKIKFGEFGELKFYCKRNYAVKLTEARSKSPLPSWVHPWTGSLARARDSTRHWFGDVRAGSCRPIKTVVDGRWRRRATSDHPFATRLSVFSRDNKKNKKKEKHALPRFICAVNPPPLLPPRARLVNAVGRATAPSLLHSHQFTSRTPREGKGLWGANGTAVVAPLDDIFALLAIPFPAWRATMAEKCKVRDKAAIRGDGNSRRRRLIEERLPTWRRTADYGRTARPGEIFSRIDNEDVLVDSMRFDLS